MPPQTFSKGTGELGGISATNELSGELALLCPEGGKVFSERITPPELRIAPADSRMLEGSRVETTWRVGVRSRVSKMEIPVDKHWGRWEIEMFRALS